MLEQKINRLYLFPHKDIICKKADSSSSSCQDTQNLYRNKKSETKYLHICVEIAIQNITQSHLSYNINDFVKLQVLDSSQQPVITLLRRKSNQRRVIIYPYQKYKIFIVYN